MGPATGPAMGLPVTTPVVPMGGRPCLRPAVGAVLMALAFLPSVPTSAQMPTQTPALADLDLRVTEADLAPQVTLRTFENRTVEAFSVNNNTYMIRITPTVGAPYYLIDQDGSGDMSWNRGQPGLETQVPQWALARW